MTAGETSSQPLRASRGRTALDALRSPTRYALLFLVASFAAYLWVRHVTSPSMIDLQVYRAEGLAVRDGLDLYGPLPTVDANATYPPFAALIFVPLSYLSWTLLCGVVVAATLVLLVVVTRLSSRLVDLPRSEALTSAFVLAGLAVWAEPVFTTLRYGQIDIALLALVLWDFTAPRESRWRGVALGIATGIKVVPGLFVIYLLLTRRYRMAVTSAVTFALTVGLSALVLPDAVRGYWTGGLFDTGRVGRPENASNQSLRGLLARIEHTRDLTPLNILVVTAVLAGGLALGVLAYRRRGDRWGLPVVAVAGLLATPVAWTHHWVWFIPITVLLWREARWSLGLLAIFWTFAARPHMASEELTFSPAQIALSAWYIAFGLLFLALAWFEVRRAQPASTVVPGGTAGASW